MREIKIDAPQTVIWRNPKSVFRYNGWPTVCCDERGVLYATASSFRIEHGEPSGKNAMFISFNGGETWTCPMIVNDSYLDDRDMGVLALGGGKILISWFSERYADDAAGHANFEWEAESAKKMILTYGAVCKLLPQEDMIPGSYVKLSDDYGVTWSEPIPVPVTCPHGPTKMLDGRVVYLGKDFSKIQDDSFNCTIDAYISKDNGRTWEKQGSVPLPEHEGLTWQHLHEPHVVQLPSGRLLGAMRVHCRKVEPADTVYTTFSDDEGKTWSMPKCVGVAGLPPHLMVHSSGAVILSYACREDERSAERACVSHDGGETWTEDYVINSGAMYDHGYPATAECPDGSLFTVYYECYPGDEFCSILGKKWSLEK